MTAYLLKTNGYNEILFVNGDKAKVTETAPDGKFNGISLYSDSTVENLQDYFANNLINDYCDLEMDEIDFNSDDYDDLTFICEIE